MKITGHEWGEHAAPTDWSTPCWVTLVTVNGFPLTIKCEGFPEPLTTELRALIALEVQRAAYMRWGKGSLLAPSAMDRCEYTIVDAAGAVRAKIPLHPLTDEMTKDCGVSADFFAESLAKEVAGLNDPPALMGRPVALGEFGKAVADFGKAVTGDWVSLPSKVEYAQLDTATHDPIGDGIRDGMRHWLTGVLQRDFGHPADDTDPQPDVVVERLTDGQKPQGP